MVDLDNAVVARLDTHGETFEILLDPTVIRDIKAGKDVDLLEHMVIDDVFNNASRGTRPQSEKILEAFGTTDIRAIASRIIEKGEIQITTEQRREMLEAKRQRIVAYISANAINPQTKLPHPPNRISMALDEVKFHVDAFKTMEKQVDEAMKLLKPLIPIRLEKSRVAVRLSGTDYGKCYEDLIGFGIVEREEWQKDGSWIGVMEIPAGRINELTGRMKDRTRGTAEVRLIS
ncbi:MAG: ribosome assembly factor SBDS [Candidatus Methanomethylophilaceae archaeon]|jgi:ribosome maturation protein SDO1|nr:RNA-associated protein [Methanomassiliicoccales archaeon RumEn M2]MDD2532545.1 ribosome assembly factor SBDS [Candidatus Methanomethylophilaceae archaeon]MDI9378581.1 ribosome assembly factor SBDS [Candidatus Thermoplasmatota archaeon]MDD2779240.1 ribosome assembly factor SBDS [Candidatus Methanomethylophilaceae archaeon]MDD3128611.1 ribosome assembly factor SBDS [Candidatus Methanomethylophilaceae archaeon]